MSRLDHTTFHLAANEESMSGMRRAIDALGSALGSAVLGVERTLELLALIGDSSIDQSGEIQFEPGDGFLNAGVSIAASGTGEAIIRFDPSDSFRVLVSAVARECDLEVVDVHGWPVLSIGDGSPIPTEAAGELNPGGGGAA